MKTVLFGETTEGAAILASLARRSSDIACVFLHHVLHVVALKTLDRIHFGTTEVLTDRLLRIEGCVLIDGRR